jgi:hypothetical protein
VDAGADWRACLEALRGYLAGAAAKGVGLRVVLGGSVVRYVLVQGKDFGWNDSNNTLILKHYFSSLYGEACSGWRFALDSSRGVSSCLAAAIEPGVIEALQQLCAERGMKLQSAQPALSVVANRWRGKLGAGTRWLVLMDQECSWLGLVRAGCWEHVKRYPRFDVPASELPNAILREKILADVDSPSDEVMLYAPGFDVADFGEVPGMKIETPDFGGPQRLQKIDGNLQLALAV